MAARQLAVAVVVVMLVGGASAGADWDVWQQALAGKQAASSAQSCSCADPEPVPLRNGASSTTKTASSGSSSAGRRHLLGGPFGFGKLHGGKGGNDGLLCSALESKNLGEACGAAIGVCRQGCCGQRGICSLEPSDCDGTSQCAYSAPGSGAQGSYPFPLPKSPLPTAPPGGLCGIYIARCSAGSCCSQFGFCTPAGSPYCLSQSCVADASAPGTCAGAAGGGGTDGGGPGFSLEKRIGPISFGINFGGGGGGGGGGNKVPTVRRLEWVVTWRNLSLDGYERPVIVVNGVPFLPIFADVGDRLIIRVTNLLSQPAQALTMHWHGITQVRTNGQDGVAAVTQRPLPPGESFVYNFVVPSGGSFWWHSHQKAQYVDGLKGALIVRDPVLHGVSARENVVEMTDWYHTPATQLLNYYLSPASGGNEPTPYTALLGGYGQGTCVVGNATGCKYAYFRADALSCASPKERLTKLQLINNGGFAVFNFSIDGHRMIVVAEDAVPIEPLEVGSLQLNNGQRYDVLVCQPSSKPVSNQPVFMRAVMIDAYFQSNSAYNQSLAVLYFTDTPPASLPTTQPSFNPPALTPSTFGPGYANPYTQLRVYGGVAPPDFVSREQNFRILFYNEPPTAANATQYAHVNTIALSMVPESPSLLERYSNNPVGLPPPVPPPVPPGGLGWQVVKVERGDIVQFVINNLDTGEHPIHLHGHWFWIMGAAPPNAGLYRPDIDGPLLKARVARDTVTVNRKSWLVLRFLATNPGLWIMHCHIDWHLAAGLGLIIQEGFPPAV